MTAAILRWILFFVATLLCLPTQITNADALQADGDLQWRRGNMHTHSLWSDGDDYLEMIALWYREHEYDFLVFTDHNVLADTERWIDVEKSKGKMLAFEKLKARFPDATQTRTTDDGRLEVRLSTFSEVSERLNAPGEFLLVQGEEISDSFEKYPIHLNVSNIAEVIPPSRGSSVLDTMQANVRAALDQRKRTGQPMIVHLNHPNFGYAVTAEDLARLVGERFFEVYNGHPGVNNSGDDRHVSTERIWDVVLTRRLAELSLPVMYGLATDDGHDYHRISQENDPNRGSNPGRGWVMVLADELTAEALIEALEAGRFYASSGVTLARMETTRDAYTVEVAAEEDEQFTIEFIGTRRGYEAARSPVFDGDGRELHATWNYSRDIGETLATVSAARATYEFQGDEIYVRARVTSSEKHPNPSEVGDLKRAWCQPAIGPAGR